MNSKLWFFLVFLSLVVFLNAHGQQSSRDLTAEYCANNWIRDPVRCADYVPKDYNEKKSEYQAQEAEKIKQEMTQSKQVIETQRVCPLGSHLGTDASGNQVCLDSKTNQVVSNPQTGSPTFDNNTLTGIVIFIVIIVIIGGIAKAVKKSKHETYNAQSIPRHGWTDSQHKEIMARQGGVCANCGEYSGSYQFDHKDGNRNNNDLDNAQGLCPNCHDRKSRGLN